MDIATASALSLFNFNNSLRTETQSQALQEALQQSLTIATTSVAPIAPSAPDGPLTTLPLQSNETPVITATVGLGTPAGDAATEIQNLLLASNQSSASLTAFLASVGTTSPLAVDPNIAGALAAFQVNSAPTVADAYAQVQSLVAEANQSATAQTLSLMG